MNPLDRSSPTQQDVSSNAPAAREGGQAGQMTRGMREQLAARPEGEGALASARPNSIFIVRQSRLEEPLSIGLRARVAAGYAATGHIA